MAQRNLGFRTNLGSHVTRATQGNLFFFNPISLCDGYLHFPFNLLDLLMLVFCSFPTPISLTSSRFRVNVGGVSYLGSYIHIRKF